MKVLHVELGRHLYGGQRQVAYLMGELPRLGGNHLLVCAEGSDISQIDLPVETLPLPLGGDLDIRFVSRLRNVIQQRKPDLLHIHSRRGDSLATLAGQRSRLPMVYSRRVDNPPNWIDRHYKFPNYQRIITISEGIRRVLLNTGLSPDRVICAPSAVDTFAYQPQADHDQFRREFELATAIPLVGMVAQMIPRKGHDVLLDTMPSVLQRYPDLQVLIFGKGPLSEDLRQQIDRRNLKESIRMMGFRTDMARILPHLDLLVHPAYMEGLGVSLLEAAACGVPIVGTRVGGIPEIVHDRVNGRLIEPGDASALADAINELLADRDDLKTMGRAGIVLVRERFSITSMAEKNHAVYRALIGGALPPISTG